MDKDQLDQLQRDQQVANTPESLLDAAIENKLKDVHTAVPGIIHSFDKDAQTAEVQPAIQRIYTDAGAMDLPLCLDVPVHFPTGMGKFHITWPVDEGDECLLIFSERCIDRWFAQGGTQEPDEYRMHDLSDGFAIVGFNSLTRSIQDFQTDGIDIRGPDRATFVTVKEDEIDVHAPTVNMSGDVCNIEFGQINLKGNVTASNGNFTKSGGQMDHDGTDVGKTHFHLIIQPVSGAPVTPPIPL